MAIEKKEVRLIGGLDNHERKGGGIQTGYQVYDKNGVSPTLLAHSGGYGNMIQEHNREDVIEETKCVGGIGEKKSNGGTQYFQQDRVYKGDLALAIPAQIPQGSYKYIVAMRGRGENNKQRLEPNESGTTNSLTTVQKDNLVMKCPQYKIRKLTPRECWRLMGFSDSDYDNSEKVNSATQLYKQAGNSIVKQVLMALFSQLNIKDVKPWNEVHR